jgi:protein-S-isoprenylcysteine O-methyltransferase Ste14
MLDSLFQYSYLAGLIVGSFIRALYLRKYKQDRKAIFREEGFAVGLLASLWGVTILLPLLYIFTRWLSPADYDLPAWAGYIGIVVFAAAMWLLWRSHADLGINWRVTTELREKHTLVTSGVFRHVRHPMYSAHWLWGIAQALLIHNWVAGLASLVIIIPLHIFRVRREEHMMLEQFGEEYRAYTSQTGRIFPRLLR